MNDIYYLDVIHYICGEVISALRASGVGDQDSIPVRIISNTFLNDSNKGFPPLSSGLRR